MNLRTNRRKFLAKSVALVGAFELPIWEILGEEVSTQAGAAPPLVEEPSTYNPDTVKEWFDKTYFNLLMDYYTEVPERPYGTGFTRENLLPTFRMVKPGFVITYAKGHSGTTAFKSRLGTEHPRLGEDPLATFRKATREAGVRMFLYYSGLIDGTAAEKHPEWQALGREGKPFGGGPSFFQFFRMVPMCPTSRYFEDWVAVHLEEIMTRYDPDGIWVDGDWGGGAACYCQSCRKICTQRFGEAAINEPGFHLWARNEFRRKFAAVIRKHKPSCLYSAGNTTPAVDFGGINHMDWQSGDWFSPGSHRIMQSMMMRRYSTLGIPYDAMTCDTQYIHSFTEMRSRAKTADRMMQEGVGLLANGGKWCYWTYPMPNGALIPSRMRVAKACSDFARERGDLWLNTQSARWTATVANLALHHWFGGNDSYFGASKALIELHRSPDLLHPNQLKEPIPYELLLFVNHPGLKAEQVRLLEKFVGDGGTILTTGSTARNPEMAALLGVKVVQSDALDEGHVLLQDGTPAGIFSGWDKVELAGAETWWKLYKSWDQDNQTIRRLPRNYPITGMLDERHPEDAGFAAVTARRLGKGLAVHITGDPFGEYWSYGYPTTRAWIREILDRMQPDPWFRCDAPSWVEVSLRVRSQELLIHFINGNPGRDLSKVGARDLFVDEIPTLGPITADLRCRRKPESVFLEPGHQMLKHEWRKGQLRFALPQLRIHSCVRVRPWPLG